MVKAFFENYISSELLGQFGWSGMKREQDKLVKESKFFS
jgi:hypothetical protein